ncbi:hypothetical protein [Methanosarcina mazei]|uniref:hypothetical protein n=1 Tax=Methanosarcina mazei TaxID=2209 RepID=UPI000A64C5B2|nr:hypothetical protein [Methanosarcina mazei]
MSLDLWNIIFSNPLDNTNDLIGIPILPLSISITLLIFISSILNAIASDSNSENNKKLEKDPSISIQYIKVETSFLKRNKDNIIISTIFLILSIVIGYLIKGYF